MFTLKSMNKKLPGRLKVKVMDPFETNITRYLPNSPKLNLEVLNNTSIKYRFAYEIKAEPANLIHKLTHPGWLRTVYLDANTTLSLQLPSKQTLFS